MLKYVIELNFCQRYLLRNHDLYKKTGIELALILEGVRPMSILAS
jgi:hypothetical protein